MQQSELKATEESAESELNRLKYCLVESLYDEFCTPLTYILLAVDLLKDYSYALTDSEKTKYIYLIRENAEKMSKFLNNALQKFEDDDTNQSSSYPSIIDWKTTE